MLTWTMLATESADLIIDALRDEVCYEVAPGCGAEACALLRKANKARARRKHTEEARILARLEALPGWRWAEEDTFGMRYLTRFYKARGGSEPDVVGADWHDPLERRMVADAYEEAGFPNEADYLRRTAAQMTRSLARAGR